MIDDPSHNIASYGNSRSKEEKYIEALKCGAKKAITS